LFLIPARVTGLDRTLSQQRVRVNRKKIISFLLDFTLDVG
jgi:hypothetical protein